MRLDLVPYSKMPFYKRLFHLNKKVSAVIKDTSPDLIVVEHIIFNKGGRNMGSTMKSSQSEMSVAITAAEHGIDYLGINSTQMASNLGVKTRPRAIKKQQTIDKINEIFEFDLAICLGRQLTEKDDDLADSLGLCVAGKRYWEKQKNYGKV